MNNRANQELRYVEQPEQLVLIVDNPAKLPECVVWGLFLEAYQQWLIMKPCANRKQTIKVKFGGGQSIVNLELRPAINQIVN